MWTFEDVAAELALAASELDAPFEVRSNGKRIRLTREHSGVDFGCELLQLGYEGSSTVTSALSVRSVTIFTLFSNEC